MPIYRCTRIVDCHASIGYRFARSGFPPPKNATNAPRRRRSPAPTSATSSTPPTSAPPAEAHAPPRGAPPRHRRAHRPLEVRRRRQRAYASDFGAFELWCQRYGLSALPAEPDTVALYLTALAAQDAAVATLRTRHRRHLPGPQGRRVPAADPERDGPADHGGDRPLQGHPAAPGRPAPARHAQGDARGHARGRRCSPSATAPSCSSASPAACAAASSPPSTSTDRHRSSRRGSTSSSAGARPTRRARAGPSASPAAATAETCPVIAAPALDAASPGSPRARCSAASGPNGRPGTSASAPAGRRPGATRLSAQGIARVVQRAAARIGLDPGEFAGHSLRSRLRHRGRRPGCLGAGDHAADRAPERRDGPPLHPRRRPVPRQRRSLLGL